MSGTVAFIGLGHMGGPMAANLVKTGHRVQGHDVVAAALDTAAGAGIAPATSAAEAVTDADVVITRCSPPPTRRRAWASSSTNGRPSSATGDR
ncbi:putative 3-hydroxyisobutyrate dehydrogenase [Streptomyces avermitilis]|uniref:6-phosphogluconate dehydrogenase NADP-binding domain-containing protein n=1 Tax=Streptomyces avermitilis TaxID=33903 RepID=A0A4D4MHR5_STRAX|nr:hypothetical protein SAVMC3_87520 [Streptomyces avermitilis]GDY68062.1 hypothetical protein SAV14893_074550 [Streptomyces avermitilis]GDY71601.1 hypothetical protein SAV31267_010860 [Streptomyces avermitilis]